MLLGGDDGGGDGDAAVGYGDGGNDGSSLYSVLYAQVRNLLFVSRCVLLGVLVLSAHPSKSLSEASPKHPKSPPG